MRHKDEFCIDLIECDANVAVVAYAISQSRRNALDVVELPLAHRRQHSCWHRCLGAVAEYALQRVMCECVHAESLTSHETYLITYIHGCRQIRCLAVALVRHSAGRGIGRR